jgi:hypothetical protein
MSRKKDKNVFMRSCVCDSMDKLRKDNPNLSKKEALQSSFSYCKLMLKENNKKE